MSYNAAGSAVFRAVWHWRWHRASEERRITFSSFTSGDGDGDMVDDSLAWMSGVRCAQHT